MEKKKMIEPIMIGIELGLRQMPFWYAITYVIDKIWEAFKPQENETQ